MGSHRNNGFIHGLWCHMSMQQESSPPWPALPPESSHRSPLAELLQRLDVDPASGLTEEQVRERRLRFGPNALPQAAPRSLLLKFADQFKGPLMLVLAGAAGLAAVVGNWKDATVILAVVVLNAALGFYQEYRAERSLSALRAMLPAKTKVRRERALVEIDADQVVPGDIVLLEAGERVPADGRLVVSYSVAIDESSLTGESQSATKEAGAPVRADTPIAEQANMAFMNTLMTRGRAEIVVTQTAGATIMGRISRELATAVESESPLQLQLGVLGRRLGAIALALIALLGFLEYLRNYDLAHALLDAIALAVAAVPEGLPAVVTVTLALGMHRMAKQHAIVKQLASVETLGCTTVICSDKTGTLTLNQMTVRRFWFCQKNFSVSGEGYSAEGVISPEEGQQLNLSPLMEPIVLCNDSAVRDARVVGDPMEAAMLVLGLKGGLGRTAANQQWPRIAEIPFDAAHKFMATFHKDGEVVRICVKGAPDVLLSRCNMLLVSDGKVPLGNSARTKVEQEYRSLAERGLRGLLVASRLIPTAEFEAARELHHYIHDLTIVGLIGLADPPRPGAKEAIARCKNAGIQVKMITGDHKDTAIAIARELGIDAEALSGAELDGIDALDLAEKIESAGVFARVAPEHKVKIVRALKARGHVVAMTGDGVNDAPALKASDIGIAMGISGTAVSKEAAHMVLIDDNFSTIVRAVRQGRSLYDNIIKFIRFQLSTTIGAILTVFFAPLAGLPEPFTPLQILWVAMIMDGPPAVSLALDAARPGLMSEPPRPRDASLLPFMRIAKIFGFGTTMMVGTLLVLHYGIHTGDEPRALTMAFTTFVLFQFFNVFNSRVEAGSAFNRRFFDNHMLWVCLLGVLGLQAFVVHWPPAQQVFGLTALSLEDWVVAVAVASCVLLLEEGRKLAIGRLRPIFRQ
jgi:Ca2+-transporting ATPase